MTSTVPSASLLHNSALAPAEPRRRLMVALTSLVAGAAGCLIAFWTWRMVLKLPLGLDADLRFATVDPATAAMPAIAWWVPTVIAGAAAVVLWATLAAHARRISLIGGAAAIVLASMLIFPVAALCIGFAALTHDGWPSPLELAGALPRVLIDAVEVTFVNLIYCGLITVPVAALIGLLLAACARLVAWTVERFAPNRTTPRAG